MKGKETKAKDNNKGITLIALVVTVIVILILAGISISTLLGNDGLINHSKNAKEDAEISEYKEQLEVIKVTAYGAEIGTPNKIEFLYTYADAIKNDNMFKNAKEVTVDEDREVIKIITEEGYELEATIDIMGNGSNIDIGNVEIDIDINPRTWTNKEVEVSIVGNIGTNMKKMYSINNGTSWEEYTNPFTVQNNGVQIQAKVVNTENNEETEVITDTIENIDRLKPNEFTPTVTPGENSITINADTQDAPATDIDGMSGILGYQFSNDDGKTWTQIQENGSYAFTNLSSGTIYEIRVKVIDNAGNDYTTQTIRTNVTASVPDGQGKITFSKNPEKDWTNQSVKVTISSSENFKIEYSLNGTNYNEYIEPVDVDKNGTIYARFYKGDEKGKEISEQITNIDKLDPNDFTVQIQGKSSSTISVKANATDADATQEYGSSGIRGYCYSNDGGKNWSQETTSNTYQFTSLNQDTAYDIVIKAIDNAENDKDSNTETVRTEILPDASQIVKIHKNPNTGWTQGPVKVTIEGSVQGYELQYSRDNSKWDNYTGEISVTNNNDKIYARLRNTTTGETTNSVEETITNIDRQPIKDFSVNVRPENNAIPEGDTLCAYNISLPDFEDTPATSTNGCSGFKEVEIIITEKNGEEVIFQETFTNGMTSITSGAESGSYIVTAIARDNAGNETRFVDELNLVATQIIKFKKEPASGYTQGPVKVTIEGEFDGYILEYSKNMKDWDTYFASKGVTVENCFEEVYARFKNPNTNKTTEIVYTTIYNIDRLPPLKFTPTLEVSGSNQITVTCVANDAPATSTDGCSGIVEYIYSISGREEKVTESQSKYTFSGLIPGQTYTVIVTVRDMAGNETESYPAEIQLPANVPDAENYINFSYSENGWTKNDVIVTITSTASSYTIQYSHNGSTWYDYNSNSKPKLTANGPIYARLKDAHGNYGDEKTGGFYKIDKTDPTATTSLSQTKEDAIVNLFPKDDESGINENSVVCTNGIPVKKLNSTTYQIEVTQNGIYTFTFEDNAGNQGSASVTVDGIDEIKLRVGDYVDYVPDGEETLSIDYVGCSNLNVPVEDLTWRVFDIDNEAKTVELIANNTTQKTITLIGEDGYNNGVYALNELCSKLYKNDSLGATARNITIEDIINKIETGYDYKEIPSGYFEAGDTGINLSGQYSYPLIWLEERGEENSVDSIPNTGTIGSSEQSTIIYGNNTTKTEININLNYFELNSSIKDHMIAVETNDSKSDKEFYYNLISDQENFYATRIIGYNENNGTLDFGLAKGPLIKGGWAYHSGNNASSSEWLSGKMRPIVEIPISSIDLTVGTGGENDRWGIKN